jgi:glycerol-3-phosphate dehydrogenase
MKLNDTVYKNTLCQGIHLVFDKSFAKRLCVDDSKQVILFAVPWHNKIVVGTTDTVMKSTA